MAHSNPITKIHVTRSSKYVPTTPQGHEDGRRGQASQTGAAIQSA